MAADNRSLTEIHDPRFKVSMTLAERMNLAMTRMDYVQKDKPKPVREGEKSLRYSIVSHDKVTALVREHCVACGIHYYPRFDGVTFRQDGNRTEVVLAVRFTSIQDPNDFIDVLGIGFGIDPGDKGPGKAISYAVKYALLKGFGLETGDDPDLDQDVEHRSTIHQRVDDTEKRMLVASADEFIAEVTSPATRAIFDGLMARDPGEGRRFQQVVQKRARELGVDLKAIGA